ncbi:MAG: A/G-specific adenine glycosylase [Bacteroidota bacterium]|nr:A/G-specific adenine glycosylase [Bacteroidota bacterium]MDX5426595.1 A/G-specific adenine glycosylase [Bacteroidota bacterium]MDX5504604.1 A/G-specific adenine glycosylase [Bacteroidota bacterium]
MFEKRLSNTLQQWYEENKRDLPWRSSPSPYHIWVSEIILQQTRVAQGERYYHRFIDRFPDIPSLASADEDELLKIWEGLGYYSRARNLHRAAKTVMEKHGGSLPNSYKELLSLPGIGPYTAAAIASICFKEPEVVVDGNVHRVIARLFGIDTPVNSNQGHQEVRIKAQSLMNDRDPGTFNQALMEFGALQCTPGLPDCDACPLISDCVAYRSDRVRELPVKKKKAPVRDRTLNFLVMRSPKGRVRVEKRGDKGIWKGLYQFPVTEGEFRLNEPLNDKPEIGMPTRIGRISQLLSHQRIEMHFWYTDSLSEDQGLWVPPDELKSLPFPIKIKDFIHGNVLPLLL